MTAKDLARVQKELGVELPASYRKFIINYPKALLKAERVGTKETPADVELLNNADTLIKLNEMVHSAPGIDTIPTEYFIVGHSGCGDYYAIDADDDDSSVYLWNHEIGDFADDEEEESIEVFARHLLESVKRVNQVVRRQRGSG